MFSPKLCIDSGIEGIDILVADVADQDSLEAMCAKSTVIINCVGPVSQFLVAIVDYYVAMIVLSFSCMESQW